jgi:hypothetical protein
VTRRNWIQQAEQTTSAVEDLDLANLAKREELKGGAPGAQLAQDLLFVGRAGIGTIESAGDIGGGDRDNSVGVANDEVAGTYRQSTYRHRLTEDTTEILSRSDDGIVAREDRKTKPLQLGHVTHTPVYKQAKETPLLGRHGEDFAPVSEFSSPKIRHENVRDRSVHDCKVQHEIVPADTLNGERRATETSPGPRRAQRRRERDGETGSLEQGRGGVSSRKIGHSELLQVDWDELAKMDLAAAREVSPQTMITISESTCSVCRSIRAMALKGSVGMVTATMSSLLMNMKQSPVRIFVLNHSSIQPDRAACPVRTLTESPISRRWTVVDSFQALLGSKVSYWRYS